MKKLLLILVLAFVSSNAMAEWVEYGSHDKAALYYKPNSIRISDGKPKVWVLIDFKSAQTIDTSRFLSSKLQYQIDCQEEQLKELYSVLYSENMGEGDAVVSINLSPFSDWAPVIPETINELLFKRACSREELKEVKAETERLQKELREEEVRRRLQKLAYALAAAKRSVIDEFKAKILAKIKTKLVLPPDLPNDPVAEFDVALFSDGEISSVKLRNSSGFRSFDKAVERAIILARPLPLPKDKSLFSNFRNLNLKVRK
jgi:hypothetical protein